ncbi:DNA polymerase III subunit delta' [soil metagenome]
MGGGGSDAARGPLLTHGHGPAVTIVRRLIRTERPPHALLLVGPRGVGKTTLALDLAAGLLCLADDRAERPCRACAACRKVASGNHPDLHQVQPDGAGEQIRIGQVQALAMELALMSLEGRFRVAIIGAAQRLNHDAQNALLKTLEEPGPRTCLVLCADDSAPLLPTVLSRCARLRLAPLPVETLAGLVAERTGLPPSQARGLALAAGGRPGQALRLAEHPEALLVRARVARTLLDLLSADRRSRLSASADLVADGAALDAAQRGESSLSKGRLQPAERRRAVLAVLDAWRAVGRDVWLAIHEAWRSVRDADLIDELRSSAPGIAAADLGRFLDRLDRMALAVESYASPELVLDSLLLAWPRPAPATRSHAAREQAA